MASPNVDFRGAGRCEYRLECRKRARWCNHDRIHEVFTSGSRREDAQEPYSTSRLADAQFRRVSDSRRRLGPTGGSGCIFASSPQRRYQARAGTCYDLSFCPSVSCQRMSPLFSVFCRDGCRARLLPEPPSSLQTVPREVWEWAFSS
jgi:hypothetical protein